MSYVVEKNVAMKKPNGHVVKYPFAQMEIGDSFFAEVTSIKLSVAANNWGARQEPRRKFSVRAEGMGTRVWRIA